MVGPKFIFLFSLWFYPNFFLHFPIFCHDTKPVLQLSLKLFYIFSGHYLVASSGILCILAYKSCALHLFAARHPLRGQYYLPNVLSFGIYPPSKFQRCCKVLMCNLTKKGYGCHFNFCYWLQVSVATSCYSMRLSCNCVLHQRPMLVYLLASDWLHIYRLTPHNLISF